MIGGKNKVLTWGSFAAVWICIAALIVISVAVPRVSAADEPRVPTLFYNDTVWALDQYYPSLRYNNGGKEDFWIPLCFYEEIADIRVRRGTAKNNTVFIIQDIASEKYLSFNLNDSIYAQTERSTLTLIHTTLFSKERYLPMRDMCAYFGWTFEISEDHESVRICDGRQTKSFDELLAVYRPPVVTETEAVTTEPVTQSPETEAVTEPIVEEPEIYRSPFVYLTFEDIEDTQTPVILDTLEAYGIRAVFFASGEQLSRYSGQVLRILAEGHAIGLHGMTADELSLKDTDNLLAALEEENELLYALVRRKTRLVRLPEGSHSGKLYLSAQQKQAVAEAGYLLWDWNISAMDHDSAYSADRVLAKIDAALQTSYYPVIRMHCTETAAQVLPVLLQRLFDTGTEIKTITEATTPVVFP